MECQTIWYPISQNGFSPRYNLIILRSQSGTWFPEPCQLQMLSTKHVFCNELHLGNTQGENCLCFKSDTSQIKLGKAKSISKTNRKEWITRELIWNEIKRCLLRRLTLYQSACWTHLAQASVYYLSHSVYLLIQNGGLYVDLCHWLHLWTSVSSNVWTYVKTVRISVRIKETVQLYCTVISLYQTSIVHGTSY